MRCAGFFLFFSFIFLTACASGFEQHYYPVPDYAIEGEVQTCTSTRTERMAGHETIEDAKARMEAVGYVLIGQAHWKSTVDESAKTARTQGEKVGACMVVWRKEELELVHDTRTVSDTVSIGDAGSITIEYDEDVVLQNYDFIGLFFVKRRDT